MIALKYFKNFIFLICLSTAVVEAKKRYPKIQDVVSFSIARDNLFYIPRVVKEIKSSIDIQKFRTNEALFRKEIRGNLDGRVLLESGRETRRVQRHRTGNDEGYREAFQYQFRTKILDSMLQLIYMARHYMMVFERKEYVDTESTAYRIGYLSKRMRFNFKKSLRLLEMLNVKQKKNLWGTDGSVPALNLHHRVAKMHVDFNYYYEVLKKFHMRVRELSNLPREKPPLKRKPQVWRRA